MQVNAKDSQYFKIKRGSIYMKMRDLFSEIGA